MLTSKNSFDIIIKLSSRDGEFARKLTKKVKKLWKKFLTSWNEYGKLNKLFNESKAIEKHRKYCTLQIKQRNAYFK